MFTCERCGAGLLPNSEQCAYCGTPSAAAQAGLRGEVARRTQAAAEAEARATESRKAAPESLEKSANRVLIWGLLSFPFMCLPVLSVLAVVAYGRVRSAARSAGLGVPTRARVGMILGVLSGAGFVAFSIWLGISMYQDSVRLDARSAELTQQIARLPNTPALSHELACALGEQRLLKNGFTSYTNPGAFRDLDCGGALRSSKDRAELADFKLRTSSSASILSATICFKRGDHWFVESAGYASCGLMP